MRAVTVRESEFSESDVAVLLASRWADDRPRGRHGILLSDATDPNFQHRWKVQKPTRDYAQQAVDQAQTAYRKAYPDGDLDSLLWRIRLAVDDDTHPGEGR